MFSSRTPSRLRNSNRWRRFLKRSRNWSAQGWRKSKCNTFRSSGSSPSAPIADSRGIACRIASAIRRWCAGLHSASSCLEDFWYSHPREPSDHWLAKYSPCPIRTSGSATRLRKGSKPAIARFARDSACSTGPKRAHFSQA